MLKSSESGRIFPVTLCGFDGWIQGEHLERKTMGILPSTLGPITQFWGPVVSQIQLLRHDLGSTSNPYGPYVEGFNWQLLNSKLSVPKILGGPTIINYPAGESFFGG